MIDAEWDSWQSSWTGATGPLPDVRARARREARLHRLANLAFFLLLAIGVVAVVPVLFDRSEIVRQIGWTDIAFCVAMAAGYLWIQRGIRPRDAGNPRDAIAFLERRLRVERRVAQLVRWVHVALCLVGLVLFPRLTATHEAPRLELTIIFAFMFILFAATFSAPWWVGRRNLRQQEEIDRWRRWMDEQHL
jgi:FtsH-binding integral membrane protein